MITRVMLNTLVNDESVSMGSQWVMLNATLQYAYIHKGSRCVEMKSIDSCSVLVFKIQNTGSVYEK